MSVTEGYQSINRGSVVFDRSDRMRMKVAGARAVELINGMLTSDVSALTEGRGQYGAALTAKGRIAADPRVFLSGGSLLIDTNSAAGKPWREMVAKFVNPRLAPYTDITGGTADIAVAGRSSAATVAAHFGIDAGALRALEPFSNLPVKFNGAEAVIIRTPEIGVECYEIILPSEAADDLKSRLMADRAAEGDPDLWRVLRIEAGRPEWGVDMDESTLPQEALLDSLGAISFTKGCYIGQEVVARIHFRGHVNRLLRKLRFVVSQLPPTGASIVNDAGAAVGDVRSTAISPRLGAIALGMIRREVEPGSTLHARWDGGEASVQVEGEKKGATA